jgi:cell division protein FtsN
MKTSVITTGILFCFALTSCKSTHPASVYAKTPAKVQTQSVIATPPTTVQTPQVAQPVETEKVTKESFKLTENETNKDPLYKTYNVVVGSFTNQENAKNLSATLKSEGKKPSIVVNEKGMFRVIIASYDDYTEATNAKIALQSRFPDAWLLVQADKN